MNQSITIAFDGGCKPTNPGNKYGSFEVMMNSRSVFKASRIELGHGTSNEAEFDSLQAALDWTVDDLAKAGLDPSVFTVRLFTDSLILTNRLKARKCDGKGEAAKRIGKLTRRALAQLTKFHLWAVEWHSRTNNVARFGH